MFMFLTRMQCKILNYSPSDGWVNRDYLRGIMFKSSKLWM